MTTSTSGVCCCTSRATPSSTAASTSAHTDAESFTVILRDRRTKGDRRYVVCGRWYVGRGALRFALCLVLPDAERSNSKGKTQSAKRKSKNPKVGRASFPICDMLPSTCPSPPTTYPIPHTPYHIPSKPLVFSNIAALGG